MTDTASPRLSRLIRDTEGFLLPLTEVADSVIVTGIDFDFDLSETPDGAIVLVTEAVHSRAELGSVVADHAAAAALVLPPGSHAHLGEGTQTGRGHATRTDLGDSRAANGSAMRTPVLLERSPHVTWSEVLVHLRQLIEGALSTVAWPDVDDLSALAAVIAESTGASITIEDPASRVLAHANLGDELDEIRRETILSGAIPAWRIAELEESGFLDSVRRSTDVVERPASGSSPARSVIALRSEGELIGTIWAAYPATIDPTPLREVLRDAARAALPVMLRTLRRSPFEKRIRREALGAILAGSTDLGPSATLLALPFSGHYATIAFAEVASDREPVLRFHLRAAFADAVLSHVESDAGVLSHLGPDAVLSHLESHAGAVTTASASGGSKGARLAALLQMREPMDATGIRDHVLAVLRRSLPGVEQLCFGVGSPVDRLDRVHRSWTEAAYVVDAVERRRGASIGITEDTRDESGNQNRRPAEPIVSATSADVAADVIGLRAADALLAADGALSSDEASGAVDAESRGVVWPARELARHDADHNGRLLETLRVYFATNGNSAEASRRLHVHTNSLRHRLGRIEAITGLSTAQPAERLWLELSVLTFDRASQC